MAGFGPPAVDFYSMLSGLGDTINANRTAALKREAFAQATTPGSDGTIDYGKAILGLAQVDPQAAALLAQRQNHADTLKAQEAATARQAERDKVDDRFRGASLALQQRAAARADDPTPSNFVKDPEAPGGYRPIGPADPEYQARVAAAKARATGDVPTIIGSGSSVIVPNRASEGAIYTNKPTSDVSLDENTLKAMAEQARAGDTSVFTNIGRGAQGGENLIRLRKEIARQNSEAGVSGTDQALRNAEMFGVKAGQRTIGTKGANIEMAATEFNQVIPVVQAASNAVSRTNYPDLNRIIQAGLARTGDPNVVKLGGGVNTLINLYARAISPTGTPTVSDKEHAREILSAAWSSGQFDAAVGMMQQEIKAALESPEKVRDEMRQRFLRGQGAAPVGYPAPGATKPIVIDGYKITAH